jgi:predicted DNA-binding ribbon-helix-helix protein
VSSGILILMGKRLQSPDKHSVLIKGRSTSLTIEPDFWEQFRLIVMEHGVTVGVLLTEIERTMRLLPYPERHRVRTLSAAVRVYVLRTVTSQLLSQRGARRRAARAAADPTPGATPDASSDKPDVSAVKRRSRSPWSLPPGMHSTPRQDDAHAPET